MAIETFNLVKEFGTPPTRVIKGLDVRVGDGEFVSISGRSGSGKSTLLYLLSSLDMPSSGKVLIDGLDTAEASVEEIHRIRNTEIGFVFQFHYLLPELTALENVLLPARRLRKEDEKTPRALALLREFGLAGMEHKRPGQLSGGEQQRVAISRALIMEPRYLFADEPTGNLDTRNGLIVMNLLKRVNRERGTAIVLVTHEPDYAAMASREIYLVDGRVSSREADVLR